MEEAEQTAKRSKQLGGYSDRYSLLERRYISIISPDVNNSVVRRVSDLELFLWRERLDPNMNLSATHKLVLARIRVELNRRWSKCGLDGFIPVYEPELAKRAGIHPTTMSRVIHILARSGIVLKHIEYKEERRHLYLALSQQALERPETLTLKEQRNHGGLRCKHCGGELVVTELTCSECGQVYRKRGKK